MATRKAGRPKSTEDKPVETREQKLIRLAAARTTKASKYILLLGNLAAYKPTGEDIDAIMGQLGSVCAQVEGRLRGVQRDMQPFILRHHPPSH